MTRSLAAFILAHLIGSGIGLGLPKPPEDALTVMLNNTVFYSGNVYVSAHADTVELKKLGFRQFNFVGRTVQSLRYTALWPQTSLQTPMPDYLTGMNYDVHPKAEASVKGLRTPVQRAFPERMRDQNHTTNRERLRDLIHANPDEYPSENMPESIRTLLLGTFYHHPVPADGRPDTVIDGKPYVHGVVTAKWYADSLVLRKDFGFRGNQGCGYETWGIGSVGTRLDHFKAYWPIEVNTDSLPPTVYRIEADRSEGAAAVLSKARY